MNENLFMDILIWQLGILFFFYNFVFFFRFRTVPVLGSSFVFRRSSKRLRNEFAKNVFDS